MLVLLQHAVFCGALCGIAVYFFMNRIVVPLSNARKYPFSVKMMVIGVVIHIFCVGLPIALMIRKVSGVRRPKPAARPERISSLVPF